MADTQQDVEAARRELEDAYKQAATHGAISGGPGTTGAKITTKPADWSPELVTNLSLGIGIFAILSFAFVAFLIGQKKRNAEQVLRTFGILIIIFAAVFLVIAGYSDTQITPVIGLLGTIAGYLLGRRIEPGTADQDEKGKDEEKT